LNDDLIRQVKNLQRRVDQLVKPEVPIWVDWTPTVTQSVSVTVTVIEAKYRTDYDLVHIYCRLTVTGAGTAGNAIIVSGWPSAINPSPAPVPWPLGVGEIQDVGTAVYFGTPRISTASTALSLQYHSTNNAVGVNPNFGLVANDLINLNMYWKR